MNIDDKLIEACKKGNLSAAKECVEQGANIHAEDDEALRWSVITGRVDLVQYLIENGVKIHAWDNGAVRWAARSECLAVVKYLVEKGADIHARDDEALRWAAGRGHFEIVKYLTEHGANIHAEEDYALRWAANRGHLEVVKYLIDQGMCMRAKNDALEQAEQNGHLEVFKYLVEQGADVHCMNNYALRNARYFGRKEIAKYIENIFEEEELKLSVRFLARLKKYTLLIVKNDRRSVMSEIDNAACPKCGAKMEEGPKEVREPEGDVVIFLQCRSCGYINRPEKAE